MYIIMSFTYCTFKFQIEHQKNGPAQTIHMALLNGTNVSVDLVPAFAFPTDSMRGQPGLKRRLIENQHVNIAVN
jgi:hypothetical protein